MYKIFVKTKKVVLLAILLLTLPLHAHMNGQNLQATKVQINLKNASILQIFKQIEAQSDFSFVYGNEINTINKRIDVNINTNIDNALKELSDEFKVDFQLINKTISVKVRKTIAQPEQQKQTISGTVTDSSGAPILGANVVVKGSSVGTATDFDGKFQLDLPARATHLVVSSVGYISQEIAINNKREFRIVLKEETQELSEVVVVGYGTQKKINLTGSVATVDSKLLESRPVTNVSSGLAGLLPGVNIRQSSGKPGWDEGTIRIRGIGTLNNSNPMVLVDGVETTMNDINPNDIANVSVLKDAASSAIYGSKAANGVILITTKTGKKDSFSVNYSTNVGYQKPTKLPEYMGSAEYATLYKELGSARFTDRDIELFRNGTQPYTHPNTDWVNLLYSGSGLQTNHDLSFSGGSEKTTYRASLGYQDQEGVIKHTGKKQYNARLNLTMTPLKWLTGNMNLSYTRQQIQQPNNAYVSGGTDQIVRQVYMISPWIPVKTQNGDYETIGDGNPIAWIDLGPQLKDRRDYFIGIGSLEVRPIEDLKIKGILSLRTMNQNYTGKNKEIQYNERLYHGPTKLSDEYYFDQRVTTDLTADYSKTLGIHSFHLLAGFHGETYDYKGLGAYREDFPSASLDDLSAGSEQGMQGWGDTRQLNMASYFGRINYALLDRYLLEGNIRYDASSRFSKNHRWGAFPSVSAGWRLSEESFMAGAKNIFNNIKIRASWGKLGNQDALNSYYPTVPVYTLGHTYAFNSIINPGAAMTTAVNKALQWESLESKGIGLDLGIINKINISFDYYDKKTTGIIMEVPAPDTFAFGGYYDNVGRVSNEGFEVTLDYHDKFGDFGVSFSGNIAYNKNKLLELADTDQIISGRTIRKIGEPIDAYFGYKTDGLYRTQSDLTSWPENKVGTVQLGDLRYVDTNGDNQITSDDRTILGSSFPTTTFGFNVGLEYKNFDLLAIFQGALGGYGYMDYDAVGGATGDTGKPHILWRDRWTPTNINASVPRLILDERTGMSMPQTNTLQYWLQSTDYLRLKNLQIGYNVPQKYLERVGLKNLRIYYSGQNLLTFTNFLDGYDPETPSGRGSEYPVVMINSIGLSVTF